MNKALPLLAAFVLAATATAAAQNPVLRRQVQPQAPQVAHSEELSLGQLTPTPSMWFYQQHMKDWVNPKLAVRRKAEARAQERFYRLAALKWYGYSNSRPIAHFTPITSSYSPFWAGSFYDPYHWYEAYSPTIVIVPEPEYR